MIELFKRYKLNINSYLKITIDPAQTGQVSKESLIQFPEEGISVFELFSYWLNLIEPPSR